MRIQLAGLFSFRYILTRFITILMFYNCIVRRVESVRSETHRCQFKERTRL